ncbi:MAG: hypothetical protein JWM57_825 [Phycisphaerales bacterium]|nr:hypothetical protein [Phycisphaerales bacterium]
MKMKAILASIIGVAALASAAEAATITYQLKLNDNGTGAVTPLSFAIYATASAGDNAGIAAFTYAVNGLSAADLANLKNKAPSAAYWNGSSFATLKNTGFTLNVAGDGIVQQTGSQDTTAASNPPLTYNIGQQAGSITTAGGPTGSTVLLDGSNAAYAFPVLLAVGSYGPTDIPTIGAGNATTAGNVFNLAKDRTTFAAAAVYQNPAVPEPASLAVLGLGGVSLLARRRKTA